jgi:hypothetical protein
MMRLILEFIGLCTSVAAAPALIWLIYVIGGGA